MELSSEMASRNLRPLQSAPEPQTVVASIVTWNHAHCIQACLESLLEQTMLPMEIIVYDNASTDLTCEVLLYFGKQIKVIRSNVNLGFCGGHNEVINSTKSDFVLLVNPDVILAKDYIATAVSRMGDAPRIGTVCGLLLQAKPGTPGCLIDGAGLNMSRSRHPVLRYHGSEAAQVVAKPDEVFGVDGALPLFRRQMIDEIKIDGYFFDPLFFAHKEDHDVAWRSQIYGWHSVFEPNCNAIHPRNFKPGNLGLRRKLRPEIKYHAVKNDLLLLLKNEDGANFLKDCFQIVFRQLAILGYILMFERTSLRAYSFTLKNLPRILQHRRTIRRNRKASPSQIRRQFFLNWRPQVEMGGQQRTRVS